MDVRSIKDVAPVVEHNGTVPVWWLVQPREMLELRALGSATLGESGVRPLLPQGKPVGRSRGGAGANRTMCVGQVGAGPTVVLDVHEAGRPLGRGGH